MSNYRYFKTIFDIFITVKLNPGNISIANDCFQVFVKAKSLWNARIEIIL